MVLSAQEPYAFLLQTLIGIYIYIYIYVAYGSLGQCIYYVDDSDFR